MKIKAVKKKIRKSVCCRRLFYFCLVTVMESMGLDGLQWIGSSCWAIRVKILTRFRDY